MVTGVNQEAVANLRKQIAQLSQDLEEFRIDHVSTIDYNPFYRGKLDWPSSNASYAFFHCRPRADSLRKAASSNTDLKPKS